MSHIWLPIPGCQLCWYLDSQACTSPLRHALVLQVGNYIQHKGGVVTAEELAPYLDVPSAAKDADSHVVDESYVVPALVRFGGSPEVDQDNNLIYRFPSLQKTGRRQVTTYTCICGALHCPNSWHCVLHDLCHAYVALSQCVALEASLVVTDTFLLEWIPQCNSSRVPISWR